MFTSNKNKCPDCETEEYVEIIPNEGLIVCTNCGTVLEEGIIDETLEIRNFDGDNEKTRVGPPLPKFKEEPLPVRIKSKNKGVLPYYAGNISGKSYIYKISKIIDDFTDQLSLKKNIIDSTKSLICEIHKQRNFKGIQLELIAASSIYICCKIQNLPLTKEEILKRLGLDKNKFIRCLNLILQITIKNLQIKPNGKDYLSSIVFKTCSKLLQNNINFSNLNTKAREIVKKIYDSEILAGRNTGTICGVSIFLACQILNIQKNKKDISDELNISESSISNSLKKLKDYKEYIFDEKDKDKVEHIQW